MITHDVDEAILLADRVLLMTNGPRARVAESVRIDIPRPRRRTEIIHHPAYYAIRNHLVEFLVRRSKEARGFGRARTRRRRGRRAARGEPGRRARARDPRPAGHGFATTRFPMKESV